MVLSLSSLVNNAFAQRNWSNFGTEKLCSEPTLQSVGVPDYSGQCNNLRRPASSVAGPQQSEQELETWSSRWLSDVLGLIDDDKCDTTQYPRRCGNDAQEFLVREESEIELAAVDHADLIGVLPCRPDYG